MDDEKKRETLSFQEMLDSVEDVLREAREGNAASMYLLGTCYDCGIGVPRDKAEGRRWREEAARHGLALAQVRLAAEYEAADPPDLEKANVWRLRAAEGGDLESQYLVGQRYMDAQGLPRDSARGAGWMWRAAMAGFVPAQQTLAQWLDTGHGVPQDPDAAEYWRLRFRKVFF